MFRYIEFSLLTLHFAPSSSQSVFVIFIRWPYTWIHSILRDSFISHSGLVEVIWYTMGYSTAVRINNLQPGPKGNDTDKSARVVLSEASQTNKVCPASSHCIKLRNRACAESEARTMDALVGAVPGRAEGSLLRCCQFSVSLICRPGWSVYENS